MNLRPYPLAAAALAVGLTAALAQPMTPTDPAAAPALVTVTGTSKRAVTPDELTFTVGISTEGEDLVQAKAELTRRVNEVIAYLRKAGVKESAIQTQWLNVSRQYRDERQLQPRYFANQTIAVKLTELARFDEINTALLQRGVTDITGPNFATSQREAIEAEVRLAAVRDARARAEALAGALGQKIGPAHAIQDVGAQQVVYPQYRMMAMEAAADGGGIAAGELEVEHSVTVAFYLYPK